MRIGLRVLFVVLLGSVLFSFPLILALNIQQEQKQGLSANPEQFPVTVDPQHKLIVESAEVNAFFDTSRSPLQAAVGNIGNVFASIFDWIVVAIADSPWYQSIAAVNGRFVNITAGMRKEQVTNAFANALAWNAAQKKVFMTAATGASLPLSEGSFSPGVYFVTVGTTPLEAQTLVNERFTKDILSHYGTETASIVPLATALSIASLIEREAGGSEDRRLISGIIWNRLFSNMHLQIDATLQYAKANSTVGGGTSWWPRPLPGDMFRKSPYNTYLNPGLPPTPIANPSVASVLAALNPKNTSCLFYFHDAAGQFHCSDTYAGHVALLKKYFGRGK